METAYKGSSSQSYGFSHSHEQMWELNHEEGWKKQPWRNHEEAQDLMLSNCGAREDSWESLGHQAEQTSPSQRKSILSIHWKG